MRRILLLTTLLQISAAFIKSYAQTAVVPRQTIFYENFSGPMVIGSFPLNDNSFITKEGVAGSFQTSINAVSTFVGLLNDVKIQDTIYANNGMHINTISGGLGPYSFIENNTDTKLMLSLSDKLYAVQFGLNTITSTSSNLLIYYEVELTEASSPVTGYNFLQYRTDPAGSWNEVPGTTYSSFGKSIGDVVTFSGITLPTCLSGTDYVEFRWITFQDGVVDIMNGDVLSFSIDNIKIDPSPALPQLSNSLLTICGSGSLTFSLVNTINPFQYRWYNSSMNLLSTTSTNFKTPVLNSSEDFYVEAYNGSCTSAIVKMTAAVYTVPGMPVLDAVVKTICGTGTLSFNVQSPVFTHYYWYNVSVLGSSLDDNITFTSPSIYNQTDYFWVEANDGICTSPRLKAAATSLRTPVSPVIASGIKTICGTGTITFTLQAPPEPFYRWYNASVGGTLLTTLTSYITPSSYDQVVDVWVTAFDGTCSSPRIQSTATFYRVPGAPVLDNGVKEICDLNPITFNIQSSTEPHYFWYHTVTGGSLLTDNPSYTTPSFYNKSDTVWVEGNSGYCTGPRSMAIGIYNRIPVLPIVDNTNKSICGTGTISFSIQNTVEFAYRWFDDASTGNLLASNTTYSTPSFNNSIKNVWVESYTGKCSSARIMAIATSYRIPELPVLDQNVNSICGRSSFTFNVDNIEASYKWYSTNGTIRASGISASTISLYDQSDTLLVEANTGICLSSRVMAVAISRSIPPLPIVVNPTDSLCGPGKITFHLTSTGSALSYRWYNALEDTNLLNTTTDYETPYLSVPTNYWVDAFDGVCFSDRVNTFAKIKDVPDPTITISNQVLTATPLAAQYQWYIGGLDKPSSQGLTHTLKIRYSGAYYVRLTNSNGCEILGFYNFIKAGGDTIYYEGFQSGMPSDYTIVNGDNADVQNVADYYTIYGNSPWAVIPATRDPTSGFFGGINNQVASATSLFANKKINANRWLITDTIELNHEGLNYNDLINHTTFSFQWKAISDDGGDYPDSYNVLISNTTKDTLSFTVLFSRKKEEHTKPILRIIDPLAPSYNGQKVFFAFQLNTPHYTGNRLLIDDLMVIATTKEITEIAPYIDDRKSISVSVYPNPAEEFVSIDYKVSKPTSVKLYVYDLIGNIIADKSFGFVETGAYNYEMELKSYPKGMYFIKVVSDSESEMVRLIIK